MRLGVLYQTSEKARFSNAIGRGALQGRCNRRISDPDCRSKCQGAGRVEGDTVHIGARIS